MYSGSNRVWSRVLALGLSAAVLAGCVDEGSSTDSVDSDNGGVSGDGSGGSSERSDVRVAFDPSNEVLPFPNNLLYEAGIDGVSDLDGTLNAPIDDPEDPSADLVRALNTLDGFSTTESWRLEFTGEVDEATVRENIRVFEMQGNDDHQGYPQRIMPAGVEREMVQGVDFEVDVREGSDGEGSTNWVARIKPAEPLAFDTTYGVVATRGIEDAAGAEVTSTAAGLIARDTGLLEHCGSSPGGDTSSISNPALDEEGVDPDQVLLQCMTNTVLEPIVEQGALERSEALVAWGVTTQREDIAFWNTADHFKEMVSAIDELYDEQYDNREIQMANFLDVESTGEEVPLTPQENARVWPGAVRLPVALPAPSGLSPEGTTETPMALEHPWVCMPAPDTSDLETIRGGNNPFEDPEFRNCNSDEARENGYVTAYPAPDKSQLDEQELDVLQTVPAVLAIPEGDRPDGGFPVVIYQHAIQQDRTNALAVADELADQGFAVVAIDMPFHGVVKNQLEPDSETDASRERLHATELNAVAEEIRETTEGGLEGAVASVENLFGEMHERTYYLDLVDEAGNEGGNGTIDPSGEHFLIPDNPLAQRDIMRQGAMDLVTLSHYLRDGYFTETCVDVDTGSDFFDWVVDVFGSVLEFFGSDELAIGCGDPLMDQLNTNEIHYVGHSVGNMVAAPFLSYDHEIASVTMLAPSGGIMRSLENSATIGPELAQGLEEAAGIQPGQEEYFRFFSIVQAALDPVDPINHAHGINAGGERPTYMAQIAGHDGADGNPVNSSDLVMPVDVEQHPLAGSTPLAERMGLIRAEGASTDLTNDEGVVQALVAFRYGGHASFLLPLDRLDEPAPDDWDIAGFGEPSSTYEIRGEAQQQVGSFLESNGSKVEIGDTFLLD